MHPLVYYIYYKSVFNHPPPKKNLAVYEIMLEKHGRARLHSADDIVRRMRLAYWIAKGYRHTLRICNNFFSTHKWLRERTSILRYIFIACLASGSSLATI